MKRFQEADVVDSDGRVLISPGLKVKHKDSQFEYTVDNANRAEFLRLSRQLTQLRKRDGAFFWEMYSRAGKANCLVEVFMVSSWLEHLRQHARVTVVDKQLQDKLRSLIVKETRPKRSHFIA